MAAGDGDMSVGDGSPSGIAGDAQPDGSGNDAGGGGDAGPPSDGGLVDAARTAADGGVGHDGGVVGDGGTAPPDGGPEAGSLLAAIPLTTPDGTYYMAQVTVGNQTLPLDVDTGSATAAIAGAGCTSCTAAGVSMLYTPSTTAVDQRKTASSVYGDGSSWNGEVFQDLVGLGHGTPSVQLDLVSIRTQNKFFRGAAFQGILGLGSSQLVVRGTTAYASQLFATGVAPVLAFELCASNGTMWVGGFDASAASSAMQYTALLNNNPFYAINVDDLAVGGQSLGLHATDFQSPIVDTGTSLFYFPTPVFTAMLSAINSSKGYASVFGTTPLSASGSGCVQAAGATAATVDAALPTLAVNLPSLAAGAPDFTLTLLPTQSYLFDAGGGMFCLAAGDGGTMQGAILGDTFLASFVTVIDRQSGRVGFAPEVGCSKHLSRRVVDLTTWHPRPPRSHGLP